jgi:hypothetical protein
MAWPSHLVDNTSVTRVRLIEYSNTSFARSGYTIQTNITEMIKQFFLTNRGGLGIDEGRVLCRGQGVPTTTPS